VTNRCPICQAKPHIRWNPTQWFVWQTWVCRGCGARLKHSARRRLYLLPGPIVGGAVMWFASLADSTPFVLLGAVLSFGAAALMPWIDRIVVVARGPFCAKCEYDLSAVEGAVCPECGTETAAVCLGAVRHPS
jgi:hypothetical protein